MDEELKRRLNLKMSEGVKELGITLSNIEADNLLRYFELLLKWNKVHNLVGPCSPDEMLGRHFLDSLSLNPYLEGQSILDLGTGGGFPGLVLAIVNSSRKFVLLDSNRKKINFVQHVVTSLQLTNVTVVRSRAESYSADPVVDTVVTRAVTSLTTFLQLADHLCRDGGLFIAMKGKLLPVLQEGVPSGFKLVNIQEVKVPGITGERNLVIVQKSEQEKEEGNRG